LRELETRYESELVVIGVQSGKYHAERVTARIRDASIRLGAAHPTVNDRQFRIWRSYAVSAWPTLVAIDAAGYVVGSHAGEFTSEMLVPFIDDLIAKARTSGILNEEVFRPPMDEPTQKSGQLKYPGKVAVSGDMIAIADSGNHRVIVGKLSADGTSMHIEKSIGAGSPGFKDGAEAKFNSPQGMSFGDGVLYVADSENHAIRAIDLNTWDVSTLAGTGYQMRTRADQKAGAMSSPWDVTLIDKTLYVAMAGIHQIWSVNVTTGQSRVHAGTGGEDIRDGDLLSSLFAQPMGITAANGRLYSADSESSAIRWIDTAPGGAVGTIVGTGLFDFGDVDASADDVRLQHVQGVAAHPGGRLLIADSYNDCLKWVDPATRQVTTWVRGLNEPGGVCCGSNYAYVADTNAHRIATVNFETGETSELRIE
jgi:DNA-binding beta-propeller fold protein YncE